MSDKIVIQMRFEFPREFSKAMAEHHGGSGGREAIRAQIQALVEAWAADVQSDYNSGKSDTP